jgi:hypothetical protein
LSSTSMILISLSINSPELCAIPCPLIHQIKTKWTYPQK